MDVEATVPVEDADGEVQEVPEEMLEALMGQDIESFLSDLVLFDYHTKNEGIVVITEDDMMALEEMRRTRAIEFSSETVDDKKVLQVRFIYRGEGKNEESDNDN